MIEKTLVNWLVNKKYECFYNFPLGGKFPDLIAIKDKELVAFELKKRAKDISTAMGQCLFYLNDANMAYIVIPKKEKELLSSSVIRTLEDQGIGLIIADTTLKILVNAKEFRKNNISVIEEIKKRKVVIKETKKKIDIKKKLIEILREHPEGLTLSDVSKYGNLSRITTSKYLAVLEAEGKIEFRSIGMAKLFKIKSE